MLNKFILMAALFFVASTSFATRTVDSTKNEGNNDDADDVQTVNITVPEVALLDITAGGGGDTNTIHITVPTVTNDNAGVGLSPTGSTETVTYALTSNVAHNDGSVSQTRTLSVEMAATSFLPAGGKLLISSAEGSQKGDTVDHESNVEINNLKRSGDLATNIRNISATGQTLTYSLEPIISGSTMSFTGTDGTSSESITLTYTLSAGQ